MMLLETYLNELEKVNYDEPKKVFSLYLNTDPRDPDQQGGEWKIKLKNALNDLEKETKKSDSHEEKNQSKEIRQKIEKEIYQKQDQLHRSVILFATADEELWFSESLNIPVSTEFHWTNQPELGQMKELVAKYPHTGVVVLQQNQAMVLEAEVGRVLETSYYQLNRDTNQWGLHEGPESKDWTQGDAKKDKHQAHVEEHQHRWFKNLAETVQKKRKDPEWHQIYLVGEKEEIEALQEQFDQEIDKLVPKNLLGRDPNTILADVYED